MKALVYDGARKACVKNVPDAKIKQPTDVLVKITTPNICGSDLHIYEGRMFRHVKVGDWICLPLNGSCGYYKNCEAAKCHERQIQFSKRQ